MNEAVYHPWANCHKTAGLLGVLLLWDNIITITPANYKPDDANPFHTLLRNKDIITELHIEEDENVIKKATDRFVHVCKTKSAIEFVQSSIANPRDIDFPEYRIHKDKVVLSRILDIKYAIPEYKIRHEQDWFYFPKELSLLYMCLLSEEVSAKRGASLLSDARESSILYKRFFIENPKIQNDNIESRKQAIVVDMIADWMAIRDDASILDILKFRDKNKHDLKEVHEIVNRLKMRIPNASDNDILNRAAKEAIVELDGQIKMIKSRLKYKGFVIQNAPMGSILGLVFSGANFIWGDFRPEASLEIAGCGVLLDIFINTLKGKAPPTELIEGHRYLINARSRFSHAMT